MTKVYRIYDKTLDQFVDFEHSRTLKQARQVLAVLQESTRKYFQGDPKEFEIRVWTPKKEAGK